MDLADVPVALMLVGLAAYAVLAGADFGAGLWQLSGGRGARERGEFISYSEWETEADVERYTNSPAHKQIVSHTRGVKGASAVVKLYDLVN